MQNKDKMQTCRYLRERVMGTEWKTHGARHKLLAIFQVMGLDGEFWKLH